MDGTIELQQLRIRCIVGVLPLERLEEQEILLDAHLDFDIGPAANSEDIRDTVDYRDLAQALTELIVQRRFLLLEALVEECAALVLKNHPIVHRVRMAVHKPAAVPQARDTVVRVERQR